MPTCIASVWVGPGWVPCEHSLRKLSVHDERAKAFAFDRTLMRYKFRWNAIEECSGSVSDEMIENRKRSNIRLFQPCYSAFYAHPIMKLSKQYLARFRLEWDVYG